MSWLSEQNAETLLDRLAQRERDLALYQQMLDEALYELNHLTTTNNSVKRTLLFSISNLRDTIKYLNTTISEIRFILIEKGYRL